MRRCREPSRFPMTRYHENWLGKHPQRKKLPGQFTGSYLDLWLSPSLRWPSTLTVVRPVRSGPVLMDRTTRTRPRMEPAVCFSRGYVLVRDHSHGELPPAPVASASTPGPRPVCLQRGVMRHPAPAPSSADTQEIEPITPLLNPACEGWRRRPQARTAATRFAQPGLYLARR